MVVPFLCVSRRRRKGRRFSLFFAKKRQREKRRRNPKPYTAHKGKKKSAFTKCRVALIDGRERETLSGLFHRPNRPLVSRRLRRRLRRRGREESFLFESDFFKYPCRVVAYNCIHWQNRINVSSNNVREL